MFIKALPNVRTLVLSDMDNPIRLPRNAPRAQRELFSSLQDRKHALITAGEDRYSITDPVYRKSHVLLPTLQRIQLKWRSSFPYLGRMGGGVQIKYMRPIKRFGHPRKTDDSHRPFRSSDTDIPYVYEIQDPPPAPNRTRTRDRSGDGGARKKQRTGPLSSDGGRSNGQGRRRRGRGQRGGRRRRGNQN